MKIQITWLLCGLPCINLIGMEKYVIICFLFTNEENNKIPTCLNLRNSSWFWGCKYWPMCSIKENYFISYLCFWVAYKVIACSRQFFFFPMLSPLLLHSFFCCYILFSLPPLNAVHIFSPFSPFHEKFLLYFILVDCSNFLLSLG